MHLAEASVFLLCAMSLAAFHISKPVQDGQVVDPVIEYSTGGIRYVLSITIHIIFSVINALRQHSHPHPFKCFIGPRSEKAEALISSANESEQY